MVFCSYIILDMYIFYEYTEQATWEHKIKHTYRPKRRLLSEMLGMANMDDYVGSTQKKI